MWPKVHAVGDSPLHEQSEIKGKTLPDLIDPLLKHVKSCMKAFVMQVKYITDREQSEDPMATFDQPKIRSAALPMKAITSHNTPIGFPPLERLIFST